jgi:hypothetical protein
VFDVCDEWIIMVRYVMEDACYKMDFAIKRQVETSVSKQDNSWDVSWTKLRRLDCGRPVRNGTMEMIK